MDIQILGAHNCESQNSKLVSILVDGVLALDAGSLTLSLSFPAQQQLKAIFLTHQHYDHIRDVPTIAFNLYLQGAAINVYSISVVRRALAAHLLNDRIYSKLLEIPANSPTINFTVMKPGKVEQVGSYSILPVPVRHGTTPAVGYQVTAPDGKTVFYTGDTGPGLVDCWRLVFPQMIISEVTASNKYEAEVGELGHLTPSLLKRELAVFREVKGYLPEVLVVHMTPELEEDIAAEVAAVAASLDVSINLAYEGMKVHL
jgi:ribonuclease BN (tRNA processing enzyme)